MKKMSMLEKCTRESGSKKAENEAERNDEVKETDDVDDDDDEDDDDDDSSDGSSPSVEFCTQANER
jgi:hypothetical protein